MNKLIIYFLLLTFCFMAQGEEFRIPKTSFERKIESERFMEWANKGWKNDYREWIFVNWRKILWAGQCIPGYGGYKLDDISGDWYEQECENWFICSTKELEEKWLNKPKPKGLDKFLETHIGVFNFSGIEIKKKLR